MLSSPHLSLNSNVAFRNHWKVWHWTGIKAPQGVNLKLYHIYAVVINVVVTLLFPLTLIIEVFFAQNLQQLCENLTITISDSQSNLKFVNVFFVRHELERIKCILSNLDARVRSQKELGILKSAISTAQTSFIVFFRLYTFGTTFSVLRIVLAEERSLLYPAWFGVNWKNSATMYAWVISYQLFGLIVQAMQNVANDSYPPAYLVILTGHMRALEERVKAVGKLPDGRQKLNLTPQEQQKCLHEFNECIKDYLNILK